MKFNIFINTDLSTYNILDINEEELNKVVDAYKYGKETFFIQGKKYWLTNLFEIQIFTFESDQFSSGTDLIEFCKKNNLFKYGSFRMSEWIPVKILEEVGEKVTDEYIKDDYGYLKDTRIAGITNDLFVDAKRIDEISEINDNLFDFTKLITFLKELNVAYANGLFLSIPLLIRAIIDHVPPLFDKKNFSEVCGSFGNRSFRDSMNNLDKSSRKIADSFLHVQIRNKESLPNLTQINFKNDLDVLLQEIVRLKK
jgi:hypothetical protein